MFNIEVLIFATVHTKSCGFEWNQINIFICHILISIRYLPVYLVRVKQYLWFYGFCNVLFM